MSYTSYFIPDDIREYILHKSVNESDVMHLLRLETAELPQFRMQIAPEQGQFMAWLISTMQCKYAIELGTFTGYSALVIAQSMAEDGRLITCDLDNNTTAIAKRFWRLAGVHEKIDSRIAPAMDTLLSLLEEGAAECFDFAFIDADKQNYLNYYEKTLELLRPGGVIIIDNVLWSGRVLDQADQQSSTIHIREFNDFLAQDQRVSISLVPLGDGMTLARKL